MNELDNTFAEIVHIIEESRDNAYRKCGHKGFCVEIWGGDEK